MRIYRCPKGCSVSDKPNRCKRCGEWMLADGKVENEEDKKKMEEKTKGITMASLPSNIHY